MDDDFAPALKLFLQAEYDEREGGIPPDRVRDRLEALGAITRAVVDLLDLQPDHRVLDIGTGSGLFALAAARAQPAAHVTGIDLSEHACAAAHRAATRLGLQNTEFRPADAERIPYPDGHFDRIIIGFALNLFPHRHDALHEATRVLAPGGRLLIAESFRPHDTAPGTGPRDLRVLQEGAHAAGLHETGRRDVRAAVHAAARAGAWPWGGDVDEAAEFFVVAYERA